MSNDKTFKAARSLTNGAITRINKTNAHILKRNDVVEIEVDENGKQVGGPEDTGKAAISGNLRYIMRALRGCETQRNSLIQAALKLKNGPATLEAEGFEVPDVDDEETVTAPGDEGDKGDEGGDDSDFTVGDADEADFKDV